MTALPILLALVVVAGPAATAGAMSVDVQPWAAVLVGILVSLLALAGMIAFALKAL